MNCVECLQCPHISHCRCCVSADPPPCVRRSPWCGCPGQAVMAVITINRVQVCVAAVLYAYAVQLRSGVGVCPYFLTSTIPKGDHAPIFFILSADEPICRMCTAIVCTLCPVSLPRLRRGLIVMATRHCCCWTAIFKQAARSTTGDRLWPA